MASSEKAILLEKHDQIGYITFNRPEKLNAIRPADYILFDELVNDCESDDNIRVIIVTGKGRAWSSGDDVEAWTGSKEKEYMKGDPGLLAMDEHRFLDNALSGYKLLPIHKTCLTLLNSGKVSIAAVNGICRIPEYLYAMDFVVAADVATFAQGDILAGLSPMGSSTQLAPRVLGRRRAIELILLCDPISAQEAYRVGLVNKVVPLLQLMPEAEAIARKIISYPITGIKLAKMAMTKAQDLPLQEGLEIEQWYASMSMQGPWKTYGKQFLAKKRKLL